MVQALPDSIKNSPLEEKYIPRKHYHCEYGDPNGTIDCRETASVIATIKVWVNGYECVGERKMCAIHAARAANEDGRSIFRKMVQADYAPPIQHQRNRKKK